MHTVKLTAGQLRRRLAVMAILMVIVPAVMVPVSILGLRGLLNDKLAQPAEKKLQQMEAPHFQRQGIRTVEQYDDYWKAAFGQRPHPAGSCGFLHAAPAARHPSGRRLVF